jgi:hypothetical protein
LICKLEQRRKGVDDPVGSNASKKSGVRAGHDFPDHPRLVNIAHRDRRIAANAKADRGGRCAGD